MTSSRRKIWKDLYVDVWLALLRGNLAAGAFLQSSFSLLFFGCLDT
jgi:hypothetical protein